MAREDQQAKRRRETTIFNDRLDVSAPALFHVVREFFSDWRLIEKLKFGKRFCWLGFRATQVGNEERGWLLIESTLGVKEPGSHRYTAIHDARLYVGSVSIRSLNPSASRVIIRINYTRAGLADLFKQLTMYILWTVRGEQAAEAWSRSVSPQEINAADALEIPPIPRLPAPKINQSGQQAEAQPPPAKVNPSEPAKKAKRRKRKKKITRPVLKRRTTAILVPKTTEAYLRWCEMWRLIREMRREYVDEFTEAYKKKPNPSIDEFRDRIAKEMEFMPSAKTVERVIAAGNAGLLKEL